jgi:hypothetical protein
MERRTTFRLTRFRPGCENEAVLEVADRSYGRVDSRGCGAVHRDSRTCWKRLAGKGRRWQRGRRSVVMNFPVQVLAVRQ